jgi:phage portal protein BeeE
VTAHQFQLTASDMQFVEARKLNQVEVCAVYDIAPTLVAILDHATFSNVSSEQMRGFYRDTMTPPLQFLQSVLNKYVGDYWKRKNAMSFAFDDVLRRRFPSCEARRCGRL